MKLVIELEITPAQLKANRVLVFEPLSAKVGIPAVLLAEMPLEAIAYFKAIAYYKAACRKRPAAVKAPTATKAPKQPTPKQPTPKQPTPKPPAPKAAALASTGRPWRQALKAEIAARALAKLGSIKK